MFTRSDSHNYQEPDRLNWIWVIVPCALVGLVVMWLVSRVAERHGESLAILALVAVPALLVLFLMALRRGLELWRALRVRLRWWHALWLLIFASALVFRVRGANDIQQNPVDAWALYRIGLELIVTAVLVTRLAVRRTPWIGSMSRGFVGLLALFGLIELLSTAWSVFPAWTLYKSCEYLLDIALLAAILATVQSSKSYRDLFNWTWLLYGLLLATVWMGVVLWPQQALYGYGFKVGILGARLNGILPALSANDVGTYAAILCLIAVSRLLPLVGRSTDRTWYLLLLAASIVTMVFSQTRSAVAGFLFGVFLLLLVSKRLGVSAFLTFVVAPLLVLSSVGGLVWSFLERGQTTRQIATLSSRMEWWTFAWNKFLERPLVGYGAYAAGRFAVLAQHGLEKTSTMHSDYLEMIVGTGIWGLIIFVAVLLGTWWFLLRFLRRSTDLGVDQQLAYEAIAVLALLTFRSVFMTMLTWHPPLHYFVIVGYAEFLRRRRLRGIPVTVHVVGEPQHAFAGVSNNPNRAIEGEYTS